MKKTLFMTFFALLSSIMSLAQSPIWVVGNQYLENFNPLPLPTGSNLGLDPILTYQGDPAEYASSAYHNPQTGELLFFVVDEKVYDHEGVLISYLNADQGNGGATPCKGSEEIAIFPAPGSCTRYYIVSSAYKNYLLPDMSIGRFSFPTFALLDLSLDNIESNILTNRKGAFINPFNFSEINGGNILGNINSFNIAWNSFYNASVTNLAQTKIAVSPLTSDNKRLVYTSSSTGILRVIIDENGILSPGQNDIPIDEIASFNITNYSGSSGQIITGDPTIRQRGEMELIRLSNGNYRIAVPYIHVGNDATEMPPIDGSGQTQSNSSDDPDGEDYYYLPNQKLALYIAELNSDGTVIPSSEKRILFEADSPSDQSTAGYSKVPYIHGLEFSPDGNTLYVTHSRTTTYPNPIWYHDFSNPNNGYFGLQDFGVSTVQTDDFKQSHIEAGSDGYLYMACNNRMARIMNPNTPQNPGWVNNVLSINLEPTSLGLYPPSVYDDPLPSVLTFAYNTYSLPDQIDFHNECQIGCFDFTCGDNSADEQCCLFYSGLSANTLQDIIVTGNTTWQPGGQINGQTIPADGIIRIAGNIMIAPNAMLNINNMQLEFSPTSRIEVARGITSSSDGAALIVNNSKLTAWNSCGDCYLWRGIEALGYSNESQVSAAQARVLISDNSIIEHAFFGVLAGKMNVTGTGVGSPSYSGAIIGGINSTFLNNRYDVYFARYPDFNNGGAFLDCDFITDENFRINTGPIHIRIMENRGIQILNCRIENETAIVENQLNRGIGIRAWNSSFNVNSLPQLPQSEFNKLRFGIYTTNNLRSLNYRVQNSAFNSNLYGISSLAENNSIISNNSFSVFNSESFNTPMSETYGIQMIHSNRYRIDNNYFTSDIPVSKNVRTLGCIINNSGASPNVVNNNHFDGLHSGSVARRNNTSTDNWNHGLKWLCNSYRDDFENDILVQNLATVSLLQGYVSLNSGTFTWYAAGNEFITVNEPTWHINSEQQQLYYLYHPQGTPTEYTSNVIIGQSNTTEQICNNIWKNSLINLDEQGLLANRNEQADSLAYVRQRKDYGNTQELIIEAFGATLTPEQRRDLLRNEHITISDKVLIEYILSNPTHQHLYQVLIYNSPLTDKVIYYMMEESDLPSGMKQQVLLHQQGISEYVLQQNADNDVQLNIGYIENLLTERYLFDTTGVYSLQHVIELYENSPIMDLNTKNLLFNLYISTNNYNKADSLSTMLKTIHNDDNYSFMNDLELAAMQTDIEILLQDSSTILMLEQIAEVHDYYNASRAIGILVGVLDYEIDFPEEIAGTKSMQYPKYTPDGSVYEPITVFPNPATDRFYIVYDEHADVSEQRDVHVYDLSGVLQFSRSFAPNNHVLEINTENMAKGMYLVVVSASGKEVGTYKVAVR